MQPPALQTAAEASTSDDNDGTDHNTLEVTDHDANSSLYTHVEALESERNGLQAQLNLQQEDHSSQMKAAQENIIRISESLKSETARRRSIEAQRDGECSALQQRLTSVENERSSLAAQVKQVKEKQRQQSETERSRLQFELASAQDEVQRLETALESLQSDFDAKTAQVEDLRRHLREAEEARDNADATSSTRIQRLSGKEIEDDVSQQELARLIGENESQDGKIQQLNQLLEEIRAMKNQNEADFTRQLTHKDHELDELTRANQKLEEEHEAAEKALIPLNKQLDTFREQNNSLMLVHCYRNQARNQIQAYRISEADGQSRVRDLLTEDTDHKFYAAQNGGDVQALTESNEEYILEVWKRTRMLCVFTDIASPGRPIIGRRRTILQDDSTVLGKRKDAVTFPKKATSDAEEQLEGGSRKRIETTRTG